ncbi:MAG: putative 4-hydroxy-4-methyl-2-oxoglutarate aldolase, partial [Steroidobacteraceae bacterium]|nr:putative 4-hydroxy-4-methyl-2-oxoglutarate aldolase [Steroidobacteraceae bacterium]
GWAGVIIDGCIRDSVVLGELPLGVLARAAVPRRSEKRGLGDRDVVLRMSGVEVRPGDYVYADEDGWIVSEQALA